MRVVYDAESGAEAAAPLRAALWRVVNSWPAGRQKALLRFVTGVGVYPSPPGSVPFRIELPYAAFTSAQHASLIHTLPTAHTCANVLEMPNYYAALRATTPTATAAEMSAEDWIDATARLLESKLLLAITQTDGYGLDTNTTLTSQSGLTPRSWNTITVRPGGAGGTADPDVVQNSGVITVSRGGRKPTTASGGGSGGSLVSGPHVGPGSPPASARGPIIGWGPTARGMPANSSMTPDPAAVMRSLVDARKPADAAQRKLILAGPNDDDEEITIVRDLTDQTDSQQKLITEQSTGNNEPHQQPRMIANRLAPAVTRLSVAASSALISGTDDKLMQNGTIGLEGAESEALESHRKLLDDLAADLDEAATTLPLPGGLHS
jgi:hypothetical protein